MREGILPDLPTLPLIVAGPIEADLLEPDTLLERATAAVFGFVAFRGLAAVYRAVRRCDGLGEGDAKLGKRDRRLVGPCSPAAGNLAAAFGRLLAAGVLRLGGVRLHACSVLPFGPFLALAAWLIWMCGPVWSL